jgi:starch synthase
VQTSAYGAGLDGVLRHVARKFTGILNGIDVEEWNPATDPLLPSHFDASAPQGKEKNKRALAEEAGLQYSPKKPLIGAVSRLVDQKGFRLLFPVFGRLIEAGAQVVLLGSGDPDLENALTWAANAYPGNARVWIGFDNALAHRIYGACDMLLMPSIYEPCGLNQMYALRYGTVPIVRLTGGLADTVIPFDGTNLSTATGFGFISQHPGDLYLASWLAMLNYKDQEAWKSLQANGMAADFSWERSAREYDRIYHLARRA